MFFMHINFLFLLVFFVSILHLILLGYTKWRHKVRPCTGDACCVMRLRSYGAIIVEETNMHELGTGLSGINPVIGLLEIPMIETKLLVVLLVDLLQWYLQDYALLLPFHAVVS